MNGPSRPICALAALYSAQGSRSGSRSTWARVLTRALVGVGPRWWRRPTKTNRQTPASSRPGRAKARRVSMGVSPGGWLGTGARLLCPRRLWIPAIPAALVAVMNGAGGEGHEGTILVEDVLHPEQLSSSVRTRGAHHDGLGF